MQPPRRLSTRVLALTGAGFFLAFFALYLRSSPASLYLDDSGETVTVAALLGIGHPPGYPLHTLLARLVSLLPWASVIWRVNLLGAGLGAAALTLLGLATGARRPPAPSGALPSGALRLAAGLGVAALAGLGPVFWHNALGAKGSIYQLNNLLSLALLALCLAPERMGPRAQRAFWLLLGAALAHHYMSVAVLLPAFAWLALRRRPRPDLKQAWLLLPGVLLYAYLPLRWSQNPGLAWGDFGTWKDFWFNFFRIQYAAGELTRSAGTSLAQALHALRLCLLEGGLVLLPLAALGLAVRRRDVGAQALGLAWLGALGAVTFYLNLKPERLDLMQPYLFPAYLSQAWLAVDGAAWLLGRLGAVPARLAAAGVLAALGLTAALRWPSQSMASYYYAEDNARDILRNLPKDSLLLAQGDALIFPLWYLQRVRHERTDVAVVGLAVLPMDWVRRDLARMHPDLRHPWVRGPIGAESVPALTREYLVLNPQRPRYATFNRFEPPLPGWSLVSEGLVWKAEPGAATGTAALAAPLAKLRAASIRGYTRRPLDPRTLQLVVGDRAVAYNSLGVAAEDARAFAQAASLYGTAAALHPEDPDYPFNQGNAWHALGHPDWAEGAYRKALTLDRDYGAAWYNLAVVLYQSGRAREAKAAFGQVVRLDPARNDVRQIMAGLPD